MKIRLKQFVPRHMTGEVQSDTLTTVKVRDVEYLIDEPRARGGTNLGPAPTEAMLGALIGCTAVVSQKIAKKIGVAFDAMTIDLEATLDQRGLTLDTDVALPFPKIVLNIEVTTEATDEEMETIKADLRRFCAVATTFRAAGTEIEEVWTVSRPKEKAGAQTGLSQETV
ncbi:MAG: OsmC family protein [Alphaproteobacteria bacterium]|nr:OsmC family protein [Alphaproteobacteria bacterium]